MLPWRNAHESDARWLKVRASAAGSGWFPGGQSQGGQGQDPAHGIVWLSMCPRVGSRHQAAQSCHHQACGRQGGA
eukprot:2787202-Alexandrium_andersonii.AAC.1